MIHFLVYYFALFEDHKSMIFYCRSFFFGFRQSWWARDLVLQAAASDVSIHHSFRLSVTTWMDNVEKLYKHLIYIWFVYRGKSVVAFRVLLALRGGLFYKRSQFAIQNLLSLFPILKKSLQHNNSIDSRAAFACKIVCKSWEFSPADIAWSGHWSK